MLIPSMPTNFSIFLNCHYSKFSSPCLPFPFESVKLHSLTAWAHNCLGCYRFSKRTPQRTSHARAQRRSVRNALALRVNRVAASGRASGRGEHADIGTGAGRGSPVHTTRARARGRRGSQLSAGHPQLEERRRLRGVHAARVFLSRLAPCVRAGRHAGPSSLSG